MPYKDKELSKLKHRKWREKRLGRKVKPNSGYLSRKGLRRCWVCKEIKNLNRENFNGDERKGTNGLGYCCRCCTKKVSKEWRVKNPDRVKEVFKRYRLGHKEQIKLYAKRNNLKRRKLVLEHYGNRCSCCGEEQFEFLAIDHKDNNGHIHRKQINSKSGTSIIFWLIKNNFPKDFQILCHNCNMAKGFYGGCPHKDLKDGKFGKLIT